VGLGLVAALELSSSREVAIAAEFVEDTASGRVIVTRGGPPGDAGDMLGVGGQWIPWTSSGSESPVFTSGGRVQIYVEVGSTKVKPASDTRDYDIYPLSTFSFMGSARVQINGRFGTAKGLWRSWEPSLVPFRVGAQGGGAYAFNYVIPDPAYVSPTSIFFFHLWVNETSQESINTLSCNAQSFIFIKQATAFACILTGVTWNGIWWYTGNSGPAWGNYAILNALAPEQLLLPWGSKNGDQNKVYVQQKRGYRVWVELTSGTDTTVYCKFGTSVTLSMTGVRNTTCTVTSDDITWTPRGVAKGNYRIYLPA